MYVIMRLPLDAGVGYGMTIADSKQKALDFLLRTGSHPPVIYVSGTKAESILVLDDLPDDHLESRKHLFVMGADLARS
jgi:hypothetical protein